LARDALVVPTKPGFTFTPQNQIVQYDGLVGSPVPSMMVRAVNCDFAATGSSPTLRVTDPNGGERWAIGQVRKVTWTTSPGGAAEPVAIRLAQIVALPQPPPLPPLQVEVFSHVLVANTPDDGSENFLVPNLPGENWRVIITFLEDPDIADASDTPLHHRRPATDTAGAQRRRGVVRAA